MSVRENEHVSAVVGAQVDKPNVDAVREAEGVIAAFLLALGELGYEVPSNSYEAKVTRSGLKIAVFDDGKPAVRTYGTAAPVEEIAEFLGDEPTPLAVGDEVRVTGVGFAGGHDGSPAWHGHQVGAVGEITSLPGTGDIAWAIGHFGVTVNGNEQAVHPDHLERT